ncbi:MAG: Endoribonuclease YbeY [Calditrichaeota bacterium]|nr:Endoribonuclease YbeY [Calditrichota bacterium]
MIRLFVQPEGWRVHGREELLAWLRAEAERERWRGALDLVLVGDEHISELNERWLGHEGPTDVLAFDYSAHGGPDRDETAAGDGAPEFDLPGSEPAPDDDFPDADIYVSLDTAVSQAADYECTVTEEVSRLLLHGLLHVAGWRDLTAAERRAITEREDQGLARAGREAGVLTWRIWNPVEHRG